jgi:hypothetical protein
LPEVFKLRELLIVLFAHEQEIVKDFNCYTVRKREETAGLEVNITPDGMERLMHVRDFIQQATAIMSMRKSHHVTRDLPPPPPLLIYMNDPTSIISQLTEKEYVMELQQGEKKYIIGRNRTGIDLIAKQSGCKLRIEDNMVFIRYNR